MGVIEIIQSAIPFLAPYPSWVKSLVVVWAFLTCALALSLILAHPGAASSGTGGGKEPVAGNGSNALPASKAPEPADNTAEGVWLVIDSVELFGSLGADDYVVRVTAEVNKQEFVYPSRAEVKWLQVGPTMSRGQFEVPPSARGYSVAFRMTACPASAARAEKCASPGAIELVSQDVHVLKSTQLGTPRKFELHKKKGATRAPTVDAIIRYQLASTPGE